MDDTNEKILLLYEDVLRESRANPKYMVPVGYEEAVRFVTRFEVFAKNEPVQGTNVFRKVVVNYKDFIAVYGKYLNQTTNIVREDKIGYIWVKAGNGDELSKKYNQKYQNKWVKFIKRSNTRRFKRFPITILEPQPPPPAPKPPAPPPAKPQDPQMTFDF